MWFECNVILRSMKRNEKEDHWIEQVVQSGHQNHFPNLQVYSKFPASELLCAACSLEQAANLQSVFELRYTYGYRSCIRAWHTFFELSFQSLRRNGSMVSEIYMYIGGFFYVLRS